MKKKAVVLLSGGLDSTTTLYLARRRGYKCFCLIFNYGQSHKREIKSAKKIARLNNCKYFILNIDLPWKGSSLIDRAKKIPKNRSRKKMSSKVPSTYVPSRNTIFLSFAASFAERIAAEKIFIGANIIDYSGYPDCGPEYISGLNKAIKKGTKVKNIKIETPLIKKSKVDIIKLAKALKVPLKLTWSCYEGKRRPCKRCDSCRIRGQAFKKAGLKDPLC